MVVRAKPGRRGQRCTQTNENECVVITLAAGFDMDVVIAQFQSAGSLLQRCTPVETYNALERIKSRTSSIEHMHISCPHFNPRPGGCL